MPHGHITVGVATLNREKKLKSGIATIKGWFQNQMRNLFHSSGKASNKPEHPHTIGGNQNTQDVDRS